MSKINEYQEYEMTNSTQALQRALDRVKDWSGNPVPPENIHLLGKAVKPAAQDSGNQK